jgi:cyclic dehypoxanthinyl futalosine synthase
MGRLQTIIEAIEANKRIDASEALQLLREADLLTLGDLASKRRHQMHPASAVTFVVDRNINYTNICTSGCRFCAFFKPPGDPEGYVISKQELSDKIQETIDLGGTQILLQGGMNPDLKLDDYLEMLSWIKQHFDIHIHGFSPPEIHALAEQSSLPLETVLKQLMEAGLGSIPGGGAEILVDKIRHRVSPNKCNTEQWLQVMRTAHGLGLKSTATMMFGHLETEGDIIAHMLKIRMLQDETGGFTAFIPWTFQPKNTRIDVTPKTSVEYLRVLALSRLVIDNIPNIQGSWVTQGEKIVQVALFFGANDIGSTMIEENVVAAAGVTFRLPQERMIRLIRDAGFQPVQRDCFYNTIRQFE